MGTVCAFSVLIFVFCAEYLDPFFDPEDMAYVKRLHSEEDLNAFCTAKVPLCVFFILDEEHVKYQYHLEQLEIFYLQQSVNPGPFSLSWIEANDAGNFMHVFGFGKGDLPGIAVYSPKKERYVTSKRDLDPKWIDDFLKGVVDGTAATFSIEVREHSWGIDIESIVIQSLPTLLKEEEVVEEAEEMEEEMDLTEIEDVEVTTPPPQQSSPKQSICVGHNRAGLIAIEVGHITMKLIFPVVGLVCACCLNGRCDGIASWCVMHHSMETSVRYG